MSQSPSNWKTYEYRDHGLSRVSSSQSSYSHYKKYSSNISAFSSVADLKAELRAKELLQEERQRKKRQQRRREREREREQLQQQQQQMKIEPSNPLQLCGINSTFRPFLQSIPKHEISSANTNKEERRDDQVDVDDDCRSTGTTEGGIDKRDEQEGAGFTTERNKIDHSAKKETNVDTFSVTKPIRLTFKNVWRVLTCQSCFPEMNQKKIALNRSSGNLC